MNFKFKLLVLVGSVCGFMPGLAAADLYAFLDENGVAHFSSAPLDDRYQLFKKGGPPEEATAQLEQDITLDASLRAPTQHFMVLVQKAAKIHQIEPALIHAVIAAESGYNSTALSPKGATGLMQLMPETGKRYGVSNLLDPAQNILGGVRYLRDLIRLFKNDLSLALAAYNAGEGAVIKHGYKIPPYRETMAYVPKVLQYYKLYQARDVTPNAKKKNI